MKRQMDNSETLVMFKGMIVDAHACSRRAVSIVVHATTRCSSPANAASPISGTAATVPRHV